MQQKKLYATKAEKLRASRKRQTERRLAKGLCVRCGGRIYAEERQRKPDRTHCGDCSRARPRPSPNGTAPTVKARSRKNSQVAAFGPGIAKLR